MKGLVHGICQDRTLNHENKLHRFSNRYLFYVAEIHGMAGLMFEYLILSDNCYTGRKASMFSHREMKILNENYTAVNEQKHLNQSHAYPSA